MAVLSQNQINAKVNLGKLLTTLRKGSKMSNMTQLAAKCGLNPNVVRKIELGRGAYPEETIRVLLPELSAVNKQALAEIEVHLRVIYPSTNRNAVASSVPNLAPAFA